MTSRHRSLFVLVILGGVGLSQAVELFINRVLRPDAEEITWLSELILACGFVLVTWLLLRLRETKVALSGLARQQLLIEAQLSLAAAVQKSLLPAIPAPRAGVCWSAAVEPAYKVGGDYYDFLPLADGRMCVVLADVSGKGVPAALYLANVRALLRALARGTVRPRQLVSDLSSALLADSASGLYVTCIVAFVEPATRSMTYVNAGHPAGILWNRRDVRALQSGGPPVGLLPDAQFEEEDVAFGVGDIVAFVSDGITEALDASGDGVVSAIATEIEGTTHHTPDAVCAHLLFASRHASGPRGVDGWMDDRTAVVFGAV